MAASGNGTSAVAVLGRLQRAEAALEAERHKRRAAEHQNAGLRSAVKKLQSLIARQRAAEAGGRELARWTGPEL
jgi:hypothetical protein